LTDSSTPTPTSASVHMTVARGLATSVLAMLAATMASALYLLSFVFVRRHVLGLMAWDYQNQVWNSPLAYGVLYAVVIVALLPIVWWRPALGSRLAVAAFVGLWALNVMIMFPRIAQWSSLVLALGAAVQGWRLATGAGDRLTRHTARAAVVFTTVYAAVLGTTLAVRATGRGERPAATAEAGAPNVILMIWDTVRAADLSAYGYSVATTPNLSMLASEGALFDRAYSNAPWTLPSHASFFTGRNPGELSADWQTPLDKSFPTIAEVLRRAGYETIGFNGNAFYGGYTTGLARGFDSYRQHRPTWRQVMYASTFGQTASLKRVIKDRTRRSVVDFITKLNLSVAPIFAEYDVYYSRYIADDLLAWTSQRTGRHPYFAFLNFYDAHETESLPISEEYIVEGGKTRRERYDLAIRHLDAQLGRIVTELRARGELDNTIIIVSADHGEHFGEHGIKFGHGVSLYDATLHVPLVIRYPKGVPAGTRVSASVELKDLGRSILSLTDVKGDFPGRSLARFWDGSATVGDTILSEVSKRINETRPLPNRDHALKRLMTDSLAYIRRQDGQEELYAYRTDSLEAHNLVDSAAWRPQLEQLRKRLASVPNPWR
jgi:arylsulfatase A-like enzyme